MMKKIIATLSLISSIGFSGMANAYTFDGDSPITGGILNILFGEPGSSTSCSDGSCSTYDLGQNVSFTIGDCTKKATINYPVPPENILAIWHRPWTSVSYYNWWWGNTYQGYLELTGNHESLGARLHWPGVYYHNATSVRFTACVKGPD
jgi:hypothetical protein